MLEVEYSDPFLASRICIISLNIESFRLIRRGRMSTCCIDLPPLELFLNSTDILSSIRQQKMKNETATMRVAFTLSISTQQSFPCNPRTREEMIITADTRLNNTKHLPFSSFHTQFYYIFLKWSCPRAETCPKSICVPKHSIGRSHFFFTIFMTCHRRPSTQHFTVPRNLWAALQPHACICLWLQRQ